MPEVPHGRLVGRETEFARLTGLLADAAAGQPVVALVSGDAGVGKTRLITELAARARDDGFAVLSGRCAELADTIPYLPLADALREATAAPAPPAPLLEALAARPVLTRLLPDTGAGSQAGGDVPGIAQQQLFGAVLGMLAELSEVSPVLLILEDLHWADGSTRDLCTFLSRVLHRERLALVLSYRTDDLHRQHPLWPVVAELLRLPSVTVVKLGPLDQAAMAEHLTTLAGGPIDAAELGEIIARAEGNPYYAEELLATRAAGAQLPAALADLMLARMAHLPAAAQLVLRAAAVAGRKADDELVLRASELPAAEYENAVREAVAHQLLVPQGMSGYAFRHALLREAIYADLLPGERTRLHARLAKLLSDGRRLAEVPGTAAELAHHSLASHDIPGAFAASVAAGHEADCLAAPAEAHRLYDQALSLWATVTEPERLAGTDRGSLALCSALSAADSGQVVRAVHQLRRLLDFLGDSDPVLRCRVNERLAYLLLEIDETAEAVAVAQAAVDALPADPPRWERAKALATHAKAMLPTADLALVRARAEEAGAAARAADEPKVEADALATLGLVSEQTGQPDEAIGLFTRAHRQAKEAKALGTELRAAFLLARVQLERGNLSCAAGPAHEGTKRAKEAGLGLAPYGLDLQYLHYLVHYADGDWDHAQQIADGFPARATVPAEARLSAMALFVDVARGSSAVADRRAWLEPFFGTDHFTEFIGRGLLAEHALWQGKLTTAIAEAHATIRAGQHWLSSYGPQVIRPSAIGLAAVADQAAHARAAGDRERGQALERDAAVLLDIAREGAAYPRRPGFVLGVDGRGWLARAEAEYLRAVGDNSPEAWLAPLEIFHDHGFSYEAARSRWRLAQALAQAGDRDAARREWLLAVRTADQLRAAPLRAALAELGHQARLGSPGADPGPAAGGPGGPGGAAGGSGPLGRLTDRELDVLRLLAAGQSNREIGASLFISPKTASVHVSNILAKLGAAGRTEAAAIAHRNGVGPS